METENYLFLNYLCLPKSEIDMTPFFTRLALTILILFTLIDSAIAQKVVEPKDTPSEWSTPYQPFQIVGNLYYVGTYDLACYLIVTPKGNILINTGLANSSQQIKANIEKLGFKYTDTRILLTTQAHYDHMGAMAAIKKATGAKMMVNKADAQVMKDGGSSDYALGGKESSYAPVLADRLLANGDEIKLGNTTVVMLHHPGHTKGSSSFIMDIKDGNKTYKVLIANMPTIVTEKKFNDVVSYKNIASDYAFTIAAMKKLSFDIWLSSHASQFNLHKKRQPNTPYNPSLFADRKGYDQSLNKLEEDYLKKIAQQ